MIDVIRKVEVTIYIMLCKKNRNPNIQRCWANPTGANPDDLATSDGVLGKILKPIYLRKQLKLNFL